jgi:hypothetical protein
MDLIKLVKSQWDRAGAIGLSLLGAVFLLFGWIGVSGTPLMAEQAPYIVSGGIGGLFLLGLGATLWISADLRDEWRKLDRIEAALGDGTLRWAEEEDPAAPAARAPRLDSQVLQTPVLAAQELPPPALPPVNGSSAAKAARTAAPKAAAKPHPAPARRTAPARPRVKATAHDA